MPDRAEEWNELGNRLGSPLVATGFQEALGHATRLGVFDQGNLIGGLVVASESALGWRLIRTPRYMRDCGLFLVERSQSQPRRIGHRKRALTAVGQWFLEQRRSLVSVAFPPDISDMQPLIWQGFQVSPKYTYELSLDRSPEQLMGAMSSGRRGDIKSALKRGYCLETGPDATEKAVRLCSMSLRLARARAIDNLDIDLGVLVRDPGVFTVVVSNGQDPLAACIIIQNPDRAYYLLGGTSRNESSASSYALWSAIEECRARQVKTFDFEGSMIPGVEAFFRGFGGTLRPLFIASSHTTALNVAQRAARVVRRGSASVKMSK